MVAKNDITGDAIKSRTNNQAYQDNYDLIFRKKKEDNTGTDKNEYQDILSTEDCFDIE